MAEKDTHCVSCKKKIHNLADSTSFMCPNCSKVEIVRCQKCRARTIKYVCGECNFEGPN